MSTIKVCTQCGTEYDLTQKFCPADGSPLRFQSADDPLIGQMVADRYQILSLIGEGGMGRVYLAEHVRMGRKSAVKVINPALATTADAISRFNREAANACKINHPNVAQVYDFGEMADGTLYLAMEYIDGETLDAIIAREGPLPILRSARITKQVADALAAAHHLGIVHRDLKPENVMVARHLDGTDWVKVVDFGIAKTIQRDGGGSQTVTTAGVSLGTPEYMSPEQLAGERLDHRTDVYSLGLVTFNMLTGQLPYPKLTSKETLVRRLTSKPRTLAEVRPELAWPAALQQTLDRALATEVADRYDNVGDFGRAVVQAAEQGGDVSSAAAGASVLPTASATAPAAPGATATPEATRPAEAKLDRPIADRRALPWALGTAAALAVVVLVALVHARQSAATQELDASVADTVVAPAAAQASATPAPPAPSSPAAPATIDTSALRRSTPRPQPRASPRPLTKFDPNGAADLGPAFADSIRRAVAGIPLSEFTHVDSLLARIGPEVERARRLQQRRPQLPLRHYWLAPNGDSVASPPLPPDAPMAARNDAAAREIRAHIARMQQRFDRGDTRGVRQELTLAMGELSILQQFDPDPNRITALHEELGQGLRNLLASCNQKRADSTLAPGVNCENLIAIPNRFRVPR
ncbi:MAG TPA: serine/threonine-protein kinase [Gemmatimonadaceae bacterium]